MLTLRADGEISLRNDLCGKPNDYQKILKLKPFKSQRINWSKLNAHMEGQTALMVVKLIYICP